MTARCDVMPDSAVMYRVGGRMYPMRSHPACMTCSSPWRVEVENLLLQGHTYASIERAVSDSGLSAKTIREHFQRRHLPLPESQRRSVIEARAADLRRSVEVGELPLVDQYSFARLGLQMAAEDMLSGILRPDLKDGIAFAKLTQDLEERAMAANPTTDLMVKGVMALMESAIAVMTPEQFATYQASLMANPFLRSLMEGRFDDARDAVSSEVKQTDVYDALPPLQDHAEGTP